MIPTLIRLVGCPINVDGFAGSALAYCTIDRKDREHHNSSDSSNKLPTSITKFHQTSLLVSFLAAMASTEISVFNMLRKKGAMDRKLDARTVSYFGAPPYSFGETRK